MKGYRYLAKNIGLLTISNFGTKILTFFLVPLYTSILSTEEYGTYDLFSTTVYVLIPLLTLNIQEAALRFSIDKDADCKGIFTTGLKLLCRGYILLAAVAAVNYFLNIIPVFRDYTLLFLIMYFTYALSGIMTYFARGMDRIFDVSVAGVLSSAVMITLNIVTLAILRWGIMGYFIANIAGTCVQCVYLFVRTRAWRYIDFKSKYSELCKKMTDYSKPLIANSIAWMINNMSDRYVVTLFLGLGENGIYSVGYKIPSILNVFQTIFNQAWSLSAVRDFDPDDKDGFFSNLYSRYGGLMTLLCSGIIFLNKPLAKLLYAKDFYAAWRYVPFLTMAIVFGALSGVVGGIFTAVKDSKIFARSTAIGAAANTIINFATVPFIGAVGAAIATLIAYVLVWVIRLRQAGRYMTLRIHLKRDILSYIVLSVQSALLFIMPESVAFYALEALCSVIILLLYRREFITSAQEIFSKAFGRSKE